MKANFKQNFIRISRGYVWVPNNSHDTLRHYAEVWVSTECMDYQLRIFPAKGMSVSWYADANKQSWRYEYSYLYMWFNVTDVAKHSIFEIHDINFFVGGLIQQTGLRIWEESRKWLTEEEKALQARLRFIKGEKKRATELLKVLISNINSTPSSAERTNHRIATFITAAAFPTTSSQQRDPAVTTLST